MITYRYYWLLAAAGIAVLFAFQPDWSEWRRDEPVVATDPVADARSDQLAIHGLELVSLEHGQLALGLDAELFWVRPRKFLFYTVAEENELYVEGVRVQIHLSPDAAGEPVTVDGGRQSSEEGLSGPVSPLLASLPDDGKAPVPEPVPSGSPLLSDIGLVQILKGFPELDDVSRINAKGITVELFRGMRRVQVLTAESASSDFSSRGMRFNNVRLERPGVGKLLTAPVALWSGTQRRLLLPEGYQETGPWGSVQGGPASLDIDFQLTRQ